MVAGSPVAQRSGRPHPHDHARPSTNYERGRPEQSVLYRVLQEYLATFLQTAAELDGGTAGVPRFVQKELRAFLDLACSRGV